MTLLPGVYKRAFARRRILKTEHPLVRGLSVALDKQAQSPLHPPYRIPRGLVVVPIASSSQWVAADDPRGDRNKPAAVSSLQPADPAWAGNLISVAMAAGMDFVVPLDQSAVDTAAVANQLNQHPPFFAHFLADEDAQGHLRIRSRVAGAHVSFHVTCSVDAAFGPEGLGASGADADYRVTDSDAELQIDGQPVEGSVRTILVGHFYETSLLALTPEARTVFARRGSIFS